MSGFIAILNLDGAPVDGELLRRMTARMAFRGPDGETTWQEGQVGFGYALLELPTGRARDEQPLSVENVTLVGDVRLNERNTLRTELRAEGLTLAADATDATLFLHAYLVWEERWVEHLSGDFAAVLWDGRNRKLVCARDHFGIKPLYYALTREALIVSNTMQALWLHPAVSQNLNERAIADFLLFGMNQEFETTTYADIQRVPPASLMVYKEGLEHKTYWSFPQVAPDLPAKADSEYVEQFRALFTRAVEDRLGSGTIAAQLSGGMDSQSIVATAHALRRAGKPVDLRTYTISLHSLMGDREAEYAERLSAQLDIPHDTLHAESLYQNGPDPASWVTPEPSGIAGMEPFDIMVGRAATASRVLLAGFGGDPVLYPSRTYLRGLALNGHWGEFARAVQASRRLNGRMPPLYLRSSLLKKDRQPRPVPALNWIDPELKTRFKLAERWKQNETEAMGYTMQENMAKIPFWSNLLSRMDPGFTGERTEMRFPFFDVPLLRFVLSVPPVPWLVQKRLLRAAMYDILPSEILERPKTPLGDSPLYRVALRYGTPEWMVSLAQAPELEGYVRRDVLLELIQQPTRYPSFEYSQVNQTLALAGWLRCRNQSQRAN